MRSDKKQVSMSFYMGKQLAGRSIISWYIEAGRVLTAGEAAIGRGGVVHGSSRWESTENKFDNYETTRDDQD